MKNLDLIAAKAAQEIIANTRTSGAGAVDNLVTKTLGVLQENGVYAAMLYLYSRSAGDEPIARKIRQELLFLTTELGTPIAELGAPISVTGATVAEADTLAIEVGIPGPVNASPEDALAFLTKHVCQNLDTLLMVKQLWEQTLIYARYGAKARSVSEEAKS